MVFRFFHAARLFLIACFLNTGFFHAYPVFSEEYQLIEVDGEAADVCNTEKECDKTEACSSKPSARTCGRYRRARNRCRKRRCCCYSNLEASWPGKMESFMDEMTR